MEIIKNFSNVVLQHNKGILKSRKDASISVVCNKKYHASPIVLSNMPCCQNSDVLEIFQKHKWPYVYHRMGGHDDILSFLEYTNKKIWNLKSISIGVQEEDFKLLTSIKNKNLKVDWITIDVAFIYNYHHTEFIKKVRALFPDVYLIAGNFTTPNAVKWLQSLGVNCGKFGISTSELCRTGAYTGFSSTVTDLIKCVEAANSDFDIMQDGGLTILDEKTGEIAYGDIFKALNFGAKWVMSSSAFRWASELADAFGNIEQYGNSTHAAKGHYHNIEGVHKFKKDAYYLEEQMQRIKENLQSSVSYAGISNICDAKNSCKYHII